MPAVGQVVDGARNGCCDHRPRRIRYRSTGRCNPVGAIHRGFKGHGCRKANEHLDPDGAVTLDVKGGSVPRSPQRHPERYGAIGSPPLPTPAKPEQD